MTNPAPAAQGADRKPRQCYWIDPTQDPAVHGGYVPSLVVEDEAGHTPMLGNGAFASPWVWGSDLDTAQLVCAHSNTELFGLTANDANMIVLSSMGAGRVVEVVMCRNPHDTSEVVVFVDGVRTEVARCHEVDPETGPGAYTPQEWLAMGQEAADTEPGASPAWAEQVRAFYTATAGVLSDDPNDR